MDFWTSFQFLREVDLFNHDTLQVIIQLLPIIFNVPARVENFAQQLMTANNMSESIQNAFITMPTIQREPTEGVIATLLAADCNAEERTRTNSSSNMSDANQDFTTDTTATRQHPTTHSNGRISHRGGGRHGIQIVSSINYGAVHYSLPPSEDRVKAQEESSTSHMQLWTAMIALVVAALVFYILVTQLGKEARL